jgi:hypothetical protein
MVDWANLKEKGFRLECTARTIKEAVKEAVEDGFLSRPSSDEISSIIKELGWGIQKSKHSGIVYVYRGGENDD